MSESIASADQAIEPDGEIRIGISACLLGEQVRFDGGHKRDRFLTDTLSSFVSFVPVCPEFDIGLGVPRESLRLVRAEGGPRLVAPKSGSDHTNAMRAYSASKADALDAEDLSGFVLKKDSPTCGLFRVREYDHNGVPSRVARGLFAAALAERHPQLPVEEEGRLNDPLLRENFFERVFAYRRVRRLFAADWSVGELVRFHSRDKMLLLAHHEPAYRELGRLVAGAEGRPRDELAREYQQLFLEALAHLASVRRHTNVLQHMAGYFKEDVDARGRAELQREIDDYRRGLVPLVVPLTLIRHYVRLHDVEYLADQTYLQPHPKELMLRNHV